MTLESYLLENTPNYDPRVVIYEHNCFIRLATGETTDQDMVAPDLLPHPPQASRARYLSLNLVLGLVTFCCG